MVTSIKTGYTVHVYQFIGALLIIAERMLSWGTNDTKPLEMDSLYQIEALNVKAGDKTDVSHKNLIINLRAIWRVATSTRRCPCTKDGLTASCQVPDALPRL